MFCSADVKELCCVSDVAVVRLRPKGIFSMIVVHCSCPRCFPKINVAFLLVQLVVDSSTDLSRRPIT